MDRPYGPEGFVSLTALRAEGCGIALWAMSMKSALRDWLFVSYGMISILVIGSLRSPPPIRLRRTSPACGGKGGGVSHQRGESPSPARAVVKIFS